MTRSQAAAHGLRILASGRWPLPEDRGRELPALPGFTASSFNPLVAEAAERCLSELDTSHGAPNAPSRTALLLASSSGDLDTARAIDAAAAATDRRMPPLLFFQSNPNAVLGHLAARWQLTGPVVAISPATAAAPGAVPSDALELAALLLADGDADQVLVIAAEQTPHQQAADQQATNQPAGDHAVALLLRTA